MTKKEYNGWTNYETWAVKLWLDNEQSSSEFWNERAKEQFERDAKNAKYDLANILKEHHEEALPELTGFAADLLNAAMSEVNWDEIAGSIIDDLKAEIA